ncbi:MAG: rod shape-determining protein [Candidatus Dadabacteria bacterium]|nr:MAG: rod shape-determining protein [Candidatus Dadabacteria bacterium]
MSTVGLSASAVRPFDLRFPKDIFYSIWSQDMAMDLGTANTLIYVKNRGIILNEPSVVAVDEASGKAVAVGHAAKNMFGKTSRKVRCIRPMKDGVIADFEMTSLMIQHMLGQVRNRWAISKPRIVIGVPSGITQVEKRAVIDAALCCGIREVMLVEEPMAAAIGSGLPVSQAVGNMIVDIGGGTTEVAIISMNGTFYSHSIRVAGDEMDEAIQRHIKRVYGLQIGIFEAERIKLVIGSALAFERPRTVTVYGRDIKSGFPQQIEVPDDIIREALHEPISAIIDSVMTALEQTSAEIAQDIISRGIYLAGGGALLRGLSERLQRETGIPFRRARDPLSCVVRGVGQIVDNLRQMRELCIC